MVKDALHERKEFSSIKNLIEEGAEMYNGRIAYSFRKKPTDPEAVKISFTQVRDDVRALTTELLSRGFTGKHCAVIGKSSYEWFISYFSILAAGAVIVPLDRDWLAPDLADTVKKADCEFLFCEPELADKAEVIKAATGISSAIYLSDAVGGDVESVSDLVALGRVKYNNDPTPYENFEADVDTMSILVFTSGTTGKGKGVMLTQRAVLSDMADAIQFIDFSKKSVSVLPPHHTFGSSVMIVGHYSIGSEVYISAGIRYVQRELKAEKPGHLVLVPLYLETFYRKILANVKDQKKEKLVARMMKLSNFLRKFGIDLRKKLFGKIREAFGGELRTVISGGAPLNKEIVDFFDGIGITTLNGYGITECAPIIAVNHSKRNIPGSVGPVLGIDKVKIDEPNEDGEGEICVKGSNVMLGYFKDEDATRDVFDEEGYFRTGDYGKIGKGGGLFITGRKKNLIILSNGKNVYPEEIENELIATPGILEIIVYEGKSKRGMEHNAIVAEVYPDKDYIEKNGITDVKAYLQPYVNEYNRTAVPYKKIAILKVREDEFPKNTLRKIMRFKLDMTID